MVTAASGLGLLFASNHRVSCILQMMMVGVVMVTLSLIFATAN
jgi:hypothetical protein